MTMLDPVPPTDVPITSPEATPALDPFSTISGPATFVFPTFVICVDPSIVVFEATIAEYAEVGEIVNVPLPAL